MTFNDAIRSMDFVVLDTETTGLGIQRRDEICQIAVIDSAGTILIDTLVKPVMRIPADATAIHRITNDMVVSAPAWKEVRDKLVKILTGRNVVIYNAVYDRKMLHQSSEAAGLEKINWKEIASFHCAMEAFAELYGDYNEYRQSFKWQALATAVRYFGLKIMAEHSALGDCLMTLAVCRAMAAQIEK